MDFAALQDLAASLGITITSPHTPLSARQVAAIRNCKKGLVYKLMDKGALAGPAGKPICVWAYSLLDWMNGEEKEEIVITSHTPTMPRARRKNRAAADPLHWFRDLYP